MTPILFWEKPDVKPKHNCIDCKHFTSEYTGDKPCQTCHQNPERPNFKQEEPLEDDSPRGFGITSFSSMTRQGDAPNANPATYNCKVKK